MKRRVTTKPSGIASNLTRITSELSKTCRARDPICRRAAYLNQRVHLMAPTITFISVRSPLMGFLNGASRWLARR